MSEQTTGRGRRPHPKEAAALALLHQNLNDHEIRRRLRMDRAAIRRILRAHHLPVQPVQPLTLVRQQAQDNKTLEGRLKAARDNNRFLDKRIADLETELLQEREGASDGDATDMGKG